MEHGKNRQPFFAQVGVGNAPRSELDSIDLSESYKRMGIPHPFSYSLMQHHTPSPAPNNKIEKSEVKSQYTYGTNEEAILPKDILRYYYEMLARILPYVTNKDTAFARPENYTMYQDLPTFDEVYRRATDVKVTTALSSIYENRYKDATKDIDSKKDSSITSKIQSLIFLEEFTSLLIASIFRDLRFNRVQNDNIRKINGREKYELRNSVTEWSSFVAVPSGQNIVFKSDVSASGKKIAEHLIAGNSINESIKSFFISRLLDVKRLGAYTNYGHEVLQNALDNFINCDSDDQKLGVKAGIQEEVKMSHKSYYAPHELLITD